VLLEVPNMQHAREAAEGKGAAALQLSGDEAVCKGQASLKFNLPGHEVSVRCEPMCCMSRESVPAGGDTSPSLTSWGVR